MDRLLCKLDLIPLQWSGGENSCARSGECIPYATVGFDEMIDQQEPSITSNVQIEPTDGAPDENCIQKAAYLSTRGGASAAIGDETEGKCFSRLRDLLRLWTKQHQGMYRNVTWTAPAPNG